MGNGANSASRGRLDKSHSTPAYDFEESSPGSLVTQVIPESPTATHTPQDSPTILVHSAEKADQILDFKKSSSQIGEAILQQQRRAGDETDRDTDSDLQRQGEETSPGDGGGERDKAADAERVLETINIAMLQHRRRSLLARPGERLKFSGADRPAPGDVAGTLSTGDEQRVPPRWARLERAPSPPPRAGAPRVAAGAAGAGVLRAVPREPDAPPARPLHARQISLPLRHITKHDIKMIPSERRELPPINAEIEPVTPTAAVATTVAEGSRTRRDSGDEPRGLTLSPSAATVKSIFPTSKSRSLKKKNSILAKRRCVAARALLAGGAAGAAWQRVRPRHAQQPRWRRRYLLLAHTALYAYVAPTSEKASCMIQLAGCTVCAAGEVKSRAHAFKVYHTGCAFYFACESRDDMLAWIHLIHRATLQPPDPTQSDISKQFSETEYSDTESDSDSPSKRGERERDRERERDKDKSKFGSLKKLAARSESHESVAHAASLDRKYLRFFSRNKSKDDSKAKNKQSGVPVPTEHYRSYRRVAAPPPPVSPDPAPAKIPKPINYIHASNPNLLDFEKSDFVARPPLRAPRPRRVEPGPLGLVTLEEFMLKKQAEERKQVYTNRVLLGVERGAGGAGGAGGGGGGAELQRSLDRIVPDVIYGELPPCNHMQGRSLPRAPADRGEGKEGKPRDTVKPISVKGKDGYEKLVYPSEATDEPAQQHERWRDSLRRNDKVHSAQARPAAHAHHSHLASDSSWSGSGNSGNTGNSGNSGGVESTSSPGVSRLRLVFRHARQSPPTTRAEAPRSGGGGGGATGGAGGAWAVYPHLQCPPTFQPESYSLARLAPAPAPAPLAPAPPDPDRAADDS